MLPSTNAIERSPERAREARQYRAVRSHILFFLAVVLGLMLAWRLRSVLELVYVSALFAVVLMPAVQRVMTITVRGRHPSRLIAIVSMVLVVLLVLGGALTLGLPPVLHDIRHFAADLPEHVTALLTKVKRLPIADKFGVDSLAQKSENMAGGTAHYLVATAPLWIARIGDVLAGAILCLYFMLEGEFAFAYFLTLFPSESRDRLSKTLAAADQRVSKWLIGQGSLMLILGVTSTIVFGFMHVRYFFMLGLLMGLFNIVPIIGGVVTILLVACVAALDSWTKMAGVLIFYAIYTQVENAYLTPRIMRSSVNLEGLAVVIALLAGWDLAGVVGALVAVPTAALLAVLLQEFLVKKDVEEKELIEQYAVQKEAAVEAAEAKEAEAKEEAAAEAEALGAAAVEAKESAESAAKEATDAKDQAQSAAKAAKDASGGG